MCGGGGDCDADASLDAECVSIGGGGGGRGTESVDFGRELLGGDRERHMGGGVLGDHAGTFQGEWESLGARGREDGLKRLLQRRGAFECAQQHRWVGVWGGGIRAPVGVEFQSSGIVGPACRTAIMLKAVLTRVTSLHWCRHCCCCRHNFQVFRASWKPQADQPMPGGGGGVSCRHCCRSYRWRGASTLRENTCTPTYAPHRTGAAAAAAGAAAAAAAMISGVWGFIKASRKPAEGAQPPPKPQKPVPRKKDVAKPPSQR